MSLILLCLGLFTLGTTIASTNKFLLMTWLSIVVFGGLVFLILLFRPIPNQQSLQFSFEEIPFGEFGNMDYNKPKEKSPDFFELYYE